jgi:MFS family permease
LRSEPLWSPALGVVMATLFLGAMVPNLFIIAPRFLGDRGYDEAEIGLVMTAFSVTSLVLMPLIAPTIARIGHARTIAAGCVVTAAGAAMFLVVDDKPGFIAARGLQGAGFAFVLVAAGSYVADIAPVTRLGEALGFSGVLTLAAQAAGPAIGEALLPLGWDVVFAVATVFAIAGAAVSLAVPRATERPIAVEEESSSSLPILVATGLAGFGFGSIWSFLADYTRQLGIENTSWFFTPYVIAAIATRLLLGNLSDRIGRVRAAVPALAGHATMLVAMGRLSAPWQLVAIGLVYGLFHGIYYPTLQAMIVERAGDRRSHAIVSSTFSFGFGVIVAGVGLGQLAHAWSYTVIYPVAGMAGFAAAALVAMPVSTRGYRGP